jgi:hypothetical protein
VTVIHYWMDDGPSIRTYSGHLVVSAAVSSSGGSCTTQIVSNVTVPYRSGHEFNYVRLGILKFYMHSAAVGMLKYITFF